MAHSHSQQEDFMLVMEGNPILVPGQEEFVLHPGESYGFTAGTGVAHQLINRSEETVTYLEISDRTAGDIVINTPHKKPSPLCLTKFGSYNTGLTFCM
jgi:uncharacterized cupin superfamily protein